MSTPDVRPARRGRISLWDVRVTAFVTAAAVVAAASVVSAAGHGQAAVRQGRPPVVGDYLKQVAAAHPAIAELVEIGRTAGNRPIHVLVISNMKTGAAIDSLVPLQNPRKPAVNNLSPMKAYMGKPGQWIDGGAHGFAPAGTEVCLYVIDKLVSGYAADPEIKNLVDANVFYICPLVYPDAAAGPGTAPSAAAPAGGNGNYPEGWWKDDNTPGGTGAYPSSSPEARALLEFFTNHTNILMVQSFHTHGGVTLRPFARWPESRVDPRDAAVFDRVLGKKYLELVGEPVPASWTAPIGQGGGAGDRQSAATAGQPAAGRRGGAGGAPPPADQPGRRVSAVDQPAAWRTGFNHDRQVPGGFGVFADWAYGQFGAYAVSTQAWDPQGQAKAAPGEALAAVCETHWQFEKYKATLLPHVEIAEASAKVLYTANQATRASAAQEGDSVAVRKAGVPGKYKVVQITATIANSGALPTQVAQGTQLRGNREDVVWLLGDRTKVTVLEGSRWMRLGVLQGTLPLPAAAARPAAQAGARGGGGRGGPGGQAGTTPLAQLRLQTPEAADPTQVGSRRVVTWLVAVEGDAPLRIAVTSQKGGTAVRDLVIQ